MVNASFSFITKDLLFIRKQSKWRLKQHISRYKVFIFLREEVKGILLRFLLNEKGDEKYQIDIKASLLLHLFHFLKTSQVR